MPAFSRQRSGPPSGPAIPTEIALGVVVRSGRLLVRPRPGPPPLGGLWELPGGKRRAGESLPEAARREVAEETGLAVETGELLVALSHRYPDRLVTLYAYVCRPAGKLQAIPGAEWLTPGQVRGRPHPDANPAILDALEWELGRSYAAEPSTS